MNIIDTLIKGRIWSLVKIESQIMVNVRRTYVDATKKSSTKKPEKTTAKPTVSPQSSTKSPQSSTKKVSPASSITYESAATPPPPSQPVGPGASKTGEYPNTEYYTYNQLSYYDLECEMTKDRLPQPKAENEQF